MAFTVDDGVLEGVDSAEPRAGDIGDRIAVQYVDGATACRLTGLGTNEADGNGIAEVRVPIVAGHGNDHRGAGSGGDRVVDRMWWIFVPVVVVVVGVVLARRVAVAGRRPVATVCAGLDLALGVELGRLCVVLVDGVDSESMHDPGIVAALVIEPDQVSGSRDRQRLCTGRDGWGVRVVGHLTTLQVDSCDLVSVSDDDCGVARNSQTVARACREVHPGNGQGLLDLRRSDTNQRVVDAHPHASCVVAGLLQDGVAGVGYGLLNLDIVTTDPAHGAAEVVVGHRARADSRRLAHLAAHPHRRFRLVHVDMGGFGACDQPHAAIASDICILRFGNRHWPGDVADGHDVGGSALAADHSQAAGANPELDVRIQE